ncbi:MAG: SBBP repeat-containing protein [Promethearchaeota archaeon]
MNFRVFVFMGSLIVLNVLIVPLWLVNPSIMIGTENFTEPENQPSSSTTFSQLRKATASLDELRKQTHTKAAQPLFLGFIQNLGQLRDEQFKYYYTTSSINIGFGSSKLTLMSSTQERKSSICFSITFPGSRTVFPIGQGKIPHYINFFYGDLQLSNVPSWKEVWYPNLYPGIDLRYYISDQGLKYDFLVHPGGDPDQIAVQVSESMKVFIDERTVSLQPRIQTKHLWLQDTALSAFQDDALIPARFIPKAREPNTYSFQIGKFDPTKTLIIDPLILTFSTFLGGSNNDEGYDIAVDNDGNSYIVGQTNSNNFPVLNAYDGTHNLNYDVFVTKLNATGNGLVFSTFLGGKDDDYGRSIAIDEAGNSYITGYTYSADFPTHNAYQSTLKGGSEVFVTKLNATGNGLNFSTYLGGENGDDGYGITVGMAEGDRDNVYVTGCTTSSDFPTLNAYDNIYNGNGDAFVTKLNASGDHLIFSTFLGEKEWEKGSGIVVDDTWHSYITGTTQSTNFPTVNPYQGTHGGRFDVFVTKLNVTGNDIVFSTFLGDTGDENGLDITLDDDMNSYITGFTNSSEFPIMNAYQPTLAGSSDAFITKLNATGDGLFFSTYLGGTETDAGHGIVVDDGKNSYVTGNTYSTNFPVADPYQGTNAGSFDAFLTKLKPTGSGLIFSTYFGGTNSDSGNSVAVDIEGGIYITGSTYSTDLPVVNPYQSTNAGSYDAFVAKFGWTSLTTTTTTTTTITSSTSITIPTDFFTAEVLLMALGCLIVILKRRQKGNNS